MKERDPKELSLSLFDIARIVKQKRRPILFGALLFACLFALYAAKGPPLFRARGAFYERGKAEAGRDPSILDKMLRSGSSGEGSEAASIMLSERILDAAVEELALHLELVDPLLERSFPRALAEKLALEYAHLKGSEEPPFAHPEPSLRLRRGSYSGERSRRLSLRFHSEERFDLWGERGEFLGEGALGSLFSGEGFSLLLERGTAAPLEKRSFILHLSPLRSVSESLSRLLAIELDEENESLLRIEAWQPSRERAEALVNALMRLYQEYQRGEEERLAEAQLAYLKKRQEESLGRQAEKMRLHARALSEELSELGFADSEREMEFLLKSHHEALKELSALRMEKERLKKQLEGQAPLAGWSIPEASRELRELAELQKERDSIGLALRRIQAASPEQAKEQFELQQAEWRELLDRSLELERLIDAVSKKKPLDGPFKLFDDPYFLFGPWLKERYPLSRGLAEEEKERLDCLDYLNNLSELYAVQKKIARERLLHSSFQPEGFEGLDLEEARALYASYSGKARELEAEIRQSSFLLEQIEDPEVEIASLSPLLKDPVEKKLLADSSSVALLLHDEEYRSSKEHERAKRALEIQKSYLKGHLGQTHRILLLKEGFLKEKCRGLLALMHSLLHTKISLIQKQLESSRRNRLETLSAEEELLQKRLDGLLGSMALLPKKWVSEQLMKQSLRLNEAVVQEVARLTESKQIGHNLEILRSGPLVAAYSSPLPENPKIALFFLLGASVGGLLLSSFYLAKEAVGGLQASEENLRLSGFAAAGALSTLRPEETLEALREAKLWIEAKRIASPLVALIQGAGPPFAEQLAELFGREGRRVLLIEIAPSALGEAPFPKITRGSLFDRTQSGVCDAFRKLCEELKKEYPLILLASRAAPFSGEAKALYLFSDLCLFSLKREKLHSLAPYRKKGCFFIAEDAP